MNRLTMIGPLIARRSNTPYSREADDAQPNSLFFPSFTPFHPSTNRRTHDFLCMCWARPPHLDSLNFVPSDHDHGGDFHRP